jgi:hypothetical protein
MKKTTLSVLAAALMAAGALGYVQGCKDETPLTVTGEVCGTITDFKSKQALSGATVEIVSNANTTFTKQSRQTDIDGKYSFADLEEGNYKVLFSLLGYLANNKDVKIMAGQTVTCDVAMTAGDFDITDGKITGYRGDGGKVEIPEGVVSIEDGVFKNKNAILSVSIPGSVGAIGADAFWNCNRLSTVSVGGGVTTIGSNAFAYCGITTFTVAWVQPLPVSANVFTGTSIVSAVLKVPTGAASAYRAATVWKDFGTITEY